jgi:transposase
VRGLPALDGKERRRYPARGEGVRGSARSAYVRAATEQQERLRRLERELQEAVKGWRLYPVVAAIQAPRGVELTCAVILMAELGDITRFDNPRQLMSYLGLTPWEYSSEARRRQGGITKAGNSHARRTLVEGAWAHRYPTKVSRHLLRLEKRPAEAQAIFDRLEGAGAAMPAVSAADGPRQARQPGRGGHRSRDGGLRLGDRAPRPTGC